MIKELKKGEIINIDNQEFIIMTKKGSNGLMNFDVYFLKCLKNSFQRDVKQNKEQLKGFKGLKLTNLKRIEKEGIKG
jgi:hypothetical protein